MIPYHILIICKSTYKSTYHSTAFNSIKKFLMHYFFFDYEFFTNKKIKKETYSQLNDKFKKEQKSCIIQYKQKFFSKLNLEC